MTTKLTRAGKGWEQKELDRIVVLFNAGWPLQDIALEMGRSGNAVVAKLIERKALICDGMHYFPLSATPWAMWQEVKKVDEFMKTEDE